MLTKIFKSIGVVLLIPVLVVVFFFMMFFTTLFASLHTAQEILENLWK